MGRVSGAPDPPPTSDPAHPIIVTPPSKPPTTRTTSHAHSKASASHSKRSKLSLSQPSADSHPMQSLPAAPRRQKQTTFHPPPRTPLRVHWARLKKIIGTASALEDSLMDATVESTDASSFRAAIVARGLGTGVDGDGTSQPGEVDEVVVDTDWDASIPLNPATSARSSPPSETHDRDRGSEMRESSRVGTKGTVVGVGTWVRWRVWPKLWKFFDLRFWSESQEERYRKDTWYTSKQLAAWAACFYLLTIILTAILVPRPFNTLNKVTYFGVAPAFSVPLLVAVLFNVPRYRNPYIHFLFQVWLLITTWSWAWFNIFDMWSCGFYSLAVHPLCGQKDFQLTSFFSVALPTISLFALGQTRAFATLGTLAYSILIIVTILPERSSWARNFICVLSYQIFIIYLHFARETADRRIFILRDQLKDQFKATQKAQVNERKEGDSKKRFVSYIFHEVRVPLNTALLASQNLVGSKAVSKDDDIEFAALEGSLKMMSKVLNDVLDFNRMDSGRFHTVSKPYCFHNAMRSMLLPFALTARSRGLVLEIELDPRIDEEANRAAFGRGAEDSGVGDAIEEGAEDGEEVEEKGDGWVLGDEMRLRQLVTNLTSNACKFTDQGGRVCVRTILVRAGTVRTGSGKGSERERSVRSGAGGDGEKSEKTAASVTVTEKRAADGDVEKGLRPSTRPSTRDSAPSRPPPPEHDRSSPAPPLTSNRLARFEHQHAGLLNLGSSDSAPTGTGGSRPRRPRESIVVRIEVSDTGVGIRPKDLVDNKLFSPYVQTEIGRYQGGKGTGLGLALVRHIVKLSGGRLGVKSRLGEGSVFWVELPLGVGPEAVLHGSSSVSADPDELESRAAYEARIEAEEAALGGSSSTAGKVGGRGEHTVKRKKSEFEAEAEKAVGGFMMRDSALVGRERTVTTRSGDSVPTVVPTRPKPPEFSSSASTLPHPLAMAPSHVSSPRDEWPQRPALSVISAPSDPARGDAFQQEGYSESPLTAVLRNAGAAGPSLTTGSLPAVPTQLQQDPPLPVLVVDDDPLTRRLMARMLTRIGCFVELAENGQVALDMLVGPGAYQQAIARYGSPPSSSNLPTPASDKSEPVLIDEHKYAVVFLDNQMPFYSGVQVVSRLREIGRETFVIGVTGNALKEDQQEYLDAGVDRILTKPVLEKDLRNMVTLGEEMTRRRRMSPPQPDHIPTFPT